MSVSVSYAYVLSGGSVIYSLRLQCSMVIFSCELPGISARSSILYAAGSAVNFTSDG